MLGLGVGLSEQAYYYYDERIQMAVLIQLSFFQAELLLRAGRIVPSAILIQHFRRSAVRYT